MDIARLLTYNDEDTSDDREDSGLSPHLTESETVNAGAPPASRPLPVAKRRPSPPRRRKATLKTMRAQVAAYECALANHPHVLNNTDAIASTSGEEDQCSGTVTIGADGQRMRAFLRRMVGLAQQIQKEQEIRAELRRMLWRHREGSASLHNMMRGVVLDDWHWTCERWRALSLRYFTPLTESQCDELVEETLATIKAEKLPAFDDNPGADFSGWRDAHRLDHDQHAAHFSALKTLWRSDIEQCMDSAWAVYENGDLHKAYNLGDNCDLFHQILQRVTPNMMILQTIERFPTDDKMTHSLSIVFRVPTETGYVMVLRWIQSPLLLSFMESEGLRLTRNMYWQAMDVAQRNARGECAAIRFTLAGSITSDDPSYAQRWLSEIMIKLVRSETKVMDTPLLTLESSLEQDSGSTSDSQQAPT